MVEEVCKEVMEKVVDECRKEGGEEECRRKREECRRGGERGGGRVKERREE